MVDSFLIHCIASTAFLGGIIFLLTGKLMQRYPPRWPNYWYGYRTMASLKTKATFDAGNTVSIALMIKYGTWLTITGIAPGLAFMEKYWWLFSGAGLLALLSAVVALIAKTEKYIKTHFDKNGKPAIT
ncbi:MAG: SdpI family protein [Bacteroidota bacterium]